MSAITHAAGTPAIVLPSVASVLRRIWPKHARKNVARAFDVPLGTAKDWIENRSCPRADQVLKAALRDATARAAFKAILEEIDIAERRLAETSGQGVLGLGQNVGMARAVAQPHRRAAAPAARVAVRRAA